MAYDAGMLSAVISEINAVCHNGARVDKVLMPTKDEVVLLVHADRETKRLSLNASSHSPRLTFTSVAKENPLTPPMFCMLLRKHLQGAVLQGAEQIGFERVARLRFATRDEMGFTTSHCLMVEIMGKYSNLMLLDQNDKILGVLHTVDFTTSRLRQVLVGMTYELPPPQDKIDPRTVTEADFAKKLREADSTLRLDKYITSTYQGTATQVAREILFVATGKIDPLLSECDISTLAKAFCAHFARLTCNDFQPTLVKNNDGLPIDYAYSPVHYYENAAKTESFSTFCQLFDAYFAAKERAEALRLKASDIHHLLKQETSRLARKMEAQQRELREAESAEDYRRKGDLITANLYRIRRGDEVAICTDWEAEGMPEVAVELDIRLSPSANAQRYYKLYNKSKTAKEVLGAQIAKGQEELLYLESVSTFLDAAECEEDLEGIRAELQKCGYLRSDSSKKQTNRSKKPKNPTLKSFTTPGGYCLLVGVNNLQNDYLTFTVAEKSDLWFHVKGMAGAHVVLVCGGEEPSERDYTFAATVAAHYSRAKGKGTAVDYTRVRELKRVPGGRPGFVVYHTNYSAYVNPDDFDMMLEEVAQNG